MITHEKQQRIWNEEHIQPTVLLQMDADDASSSVVKFGEYLRSTGKKDLVGIEMGCGKGRNVIWLAEQNFVRKAYGFDFSPAAIAVAERRAVERGGVGKTEFFVADATVPWNFASSTFDFVIDCFSSTDIESAVGRKSAILEIERTMKSGGFLMVYTLTPEDEFHKEMIKKNPAEEQGAFYHSTGKFEKTFTKEELEEMYKNFKVIEWQRVDKVTQFFGKEYRCRHYWILFQKP